MILHESDTRTIMNDSNTQTIMQDTLTITNLLNFHEKTNDNDKKRKQTVLHLWKRIIKNIFQDWD